MKGFAGFYLGLCFVKFLIFAWESKWHIETIRKGNIWMGDIVGVAMALYILGWV